MSNERTDRDDGFGAVDALRIVGRLLKAAFRALFVGLTILVSVVRSEENRRRVEHWLLLEAKRETITYGLVVGIFVGTLVLGFTDVIGVRESGFVTTMFSTIIAGLFSFVPLVVAINQLTISRVLGSPETLREQVESVHRFRCDVEEMSPDVDVSPTDPAQFVGVLFDAIHERATALEAACAESPDHDLRSEVSEYAGELADRAETIHEHVDGGDLRLWAILLPVMHDNYSVQFNRARRIEVTYEDVLSPEADDLLDDLRELFVSVDVTRQYFKTVYLQQELARLSRRIAYSGGVALLVSTLVIMIYATGYPPVVEEVFLLGLVTASLAVAFAPFAILFSYVIRIATILKRTSAPGAFTPKGERPKRARE